MPENEYGGTSPVDMLMTAFGDHGVDFMTDEEHDFHVAIDADGEPHEFWDGGTPDHVNVVIAMTIDEAVGYFTNPGALRENAKLRKQCKELMKQKDCKWCYDRGSECAIVDRLCELGIEVPS